MNETTYISRRTTQAGKSLSVRRRRGFTLVELLIVIAIIALLAGMIFPITKALNRSKLRTRAKGELALLETAIQSYKSKVGVYPPDNPGNPYVHQLYYELLGTVTTNVGGQTFYRTLDGSSQIPADPGGLSAIFGPRVTGIMNTARPGAGDEASGGQNFLRTLNANQVGLLTGNANGPRIICSSVPWPESHPAHPIPARKTLNPWRYVSSGPTNNPNTFDLWLDIIVDGKTNRISNWSREPLVVYEGP